MRAGTYQLVGHLHLLQRVALLWVGYAWPQSPFGPVGQEDRKHCCFGVQERKVDFKKTF